MPGTASKSKTKAAPPVPNYADRIARLRARLAKDGFGAGLITNPLDVAYLTGFLGGDSYLLLTADAAAIISDRRYEEELEPFRRLVDIHMRSGAMPAAVAEVFAGHQISRCAVQADHLTIADCSAISDALGDADRLAPVKGLLTAMRAIKDDAEIALIEHAIKIQQDALKAVLPTIKPGQTELAIAAAIEAEMKVRGSSEPGFKTIVAVGANGSLPHYRPQAVKARAKTPILIDWGAVYKGYHGDLTRVVCLGEWPKKIAEIFTIVLEAQETAAAGLKAGRTTREIDALARDVIARAGYGDFFGHGLGHGIGFNGHEDPRLSHMLPPEELKPGHVVTIEPGIYLPGVGGVRIEDDYLVTETGSRRLSSLPKSLKWGTL